MKTAADKYEYLFDKPYAVSAGDPIGMLPAAGQISYRTKTIKAGPICEVEIFPMWNTRTDRQRARGHESREAQTRQNRKNAAKKFIRTVNANFTDDPAALHITGTYDPKQHDLPDEAAAQRDIRNYIKRCRRVARLNGNDIKYVYVIEWADGDGRRVQVHHHIIMSGLPRRDAMRLWGKGIVTADELQPQDGALDGLATYILKQPGKKRTKKWGYSLNLKKPTITVSNTKISRRKAHELAGDAEAFAPHIFGQHYPAYTFDECTVKVSDFVSGVYIYARLHKEPPKKKPRGRRKRE
jgi:hypothetical protein